MEEPIIWNPPREGGRREGRREGRGRSERVVVGRREM